MNIKTQLFQPQRTKTLGGEDYLACTVWFTNLVLTAVAVSNFIYTFESGVRSGAMTCFAQKRVQLQDLTPCDDMEDEKNQEGTASMQTQGRRAV